MQPVHETFHPVHVLGRLYVLIGEIRYYWLEIAVVINVHRVGQLHHHLFSFANSRLNHLHTLKVSCITVCSVLSMLKAALELTFKLVLTDKKTTSRIQVHVKRLGNGSWYFHMARASASLSALWIKASPTRKKIEQDIKPD